MNCVNCGKPFTPSAETPDADSCSLLCFRSYVIHRSARLSLVSPKRKPITLTDSNGRAIPLED